MNADRTGPKPMPRQPFAHALRRLPRVLPAALLAVTLTAAAGAFDTAPAVSEDDVTAYKSGKRFVVDAVMHAPVPPALAWAVLTDFEHMTDFVPNLSFSRVTARQDTLLTVHQKGTGRYGFFSADFESVREIHLVPLREIRSRGIGGNIRQVESLMQLEAEGTGTRLHYHSEAQPGFWLPPLIGPAVARHETAEQFSAMIREMQRRQSSPAADAR